MDARIVRCCVSLAALLAGMSALAQEKPLVRWLVSDFPPYHIVSGPDAGRGIRDNFLRQVEADLPGFTHQNEPSIIARTQGMIKAGENVCTVSLLRTPEREAWAVFSAKPYAHQLPVRLIALADDKVTAALVKDDEVSLADLLHSGRRRLGLQTGRRYGAALDGVIAAAHAAGVRTESFSAEASLPTAVTMMKNGRFDITLGYSVESEHIRTMHPEMPALRYYPIAESRGLGPQYIACARNKLGESVMAAVDRGTPGRAAQKAMRRAYVSHLPADEQRRYGALMND